MTEYDSRRTGNRLLDMGSTPIWSTKHEVQEFRAGHYRKKRREGV